MKRRAGREWTVSNRPGLDILRALAFLLVFVAHGLVSEINRPTQAGAIARMGNLASPSFSFLARTSLQSCCCGKSVTPAPSTFQRLCAADPSHLAALFRHDRRGLVLWSVLPSHALSFAWGASLLLLFTNWYTVRTWLSARLSLSPMEYLGRGTVLPRLAVDCEIPKAGLRSWGLLPC